MNSRFEKQVSPLQRQLISLNAECLRACHQKHKLAASSSRSKFRIVYRCHESKRKVPEVNRHPTCGISQPKSLQHKRRVMCLQHLEQAQLHLQVETKNA